VGRDEDRVLIKSTGEPTYRLPDIAYHKDKVERGYDLIVDIFGADHQDTYPDVLAGVQGLGYDTAHIKVLIHQFVTLTRGGQQVKMSTRKATFVTLDDLISDVGRDVVRYFFIMRGMGTHLQFDLDLAKDTSDENPVYYLQYAHARMVNIRKRAEAFDYDIEPDSAPLELLGLPEERTVMLLLWWFQEVVQQAYQTLEPQTIATYLQELATAYHRLYTVARVVTEDAPMSTARLVLTEACRQTMANGLAILGISAPERM
jgi:arginyl-tRNA synthetase